jgi:tRNA(fMet)-specific endonuclease VapC
MSRRYLLDSNAVSDLIYRRRGVYERAMIAQKSGAKIGTCPPVVGELYYGAKLTDDPDRFTREITRGIVPLTIWPYGLAEAEAFGRLRAELKRIGRPMQIPDIQLAAVAMGLGNCTVITSDSDLLAVPGLRVENWITLGG